MGEKNYKNGYFKAFCVTHKRNKVIRHEFIKNYSFFSLTKKHVEITFLKCNAFKTDI